MKDKIEVIDLFRYPMGIVNLNQNIKELIKFSKEVQKNEKSVFKTNRGGFQTSPDIEKYNKPIFNHLYSIIFKLAGKFSGIYNLNKPIKYGNAWININTPYSFNALHTHPKAIISAVFYIKVPKNSGQIIFRRPEKLIGYLDDDDIHMYNSFNAFSQIFTPKENQLFLFPAWLEHEVSQNLSKQDRISLAINFECTK